jgi:membrane fusion protein, multidrug efflux system
MGGKSRKIIWLAVIAFILTAAGTFAIMKTGPHAADGHAPGGAPQAMPVKVTIAEKKPLRLWTSYSGRLEAVDYVELRPQVEGRIEEVKFEDGQIVNKDDVLFVIDPRPYQASVAEAEAALAGAKSQHELATKELKRAQDLIKTEAVSQRLVDERKSTSQVSKNSLGAAQAQLDKARINLDHAYLKAPISGRVGRADLTVGNLVQLGANAPVLTTIVSDQGIYADFEVDEQTYLKSIRQQSKDNGPQEQTPVQLVLNSDQQSTYKGFIKSFDNRINTSSGTIRARAYFDNADGTLLPGMFVTVKLGSPSEDEVILVSEQAIGTDQNRKFVYVVSPENKVAYRPVQLGASVDGQRIITSGIEPGDKIIMDTMKIMPDMPVVPQVAGETPAPVQTAPAAGDGKGE